MKTTSAVSASGGAPSSKIRLRFQLQNGTNQNDEEYALTLFANEKIYSVKERLEQQFGIPSKYLQLMCANVPLDDAYTLQQYGMFVREDSLITVLVSPDFNLINLLKLPQQTNVDLPSSPSLYDAVGEGLNFMQPNMDMGMYQFPFYLLQQQQQLQSMGQYQPQFPVPYQPHQQMPAPYYQQGSPMHQLPSDQVPYYNAHYMVPPQSAHSSYFRQSMDETSEQHQKQPQQAQQQQFQTSQLESRQSSLQQESQQQQQHQQRQQQSQQPQQQSRETQQRSPAAHQQGFYWHDGGGMYYPGYGSYGSERDMGSLSYPTDSYASAGSYSLGMGGIISPPSISVGSSSLTSSFTRAEALSDRGEKAEAKERELSRKVEQQPQQRKADVSVQQQSVSMEKRQEVQSSNKIETTHPTASSDMQSNSQKQQQVVHRQGGEEKIRTSEEIYHDNFEEKAKEKEVLKSVTTATSATTTTPHYSSGGRGRGSSYGNNRPPSSSYGGRGSRGAPRGGPTARGGYGYDMNATRRAYPTQSPYIATTTTPTTTTTTPATTYPQQPYHGVAHRGSPYHDYTYAPRGGRGRGSAPPMGVVPRVSSYPPRGGSGVPPPPSSFTHPASSMRGGRGRGGSAWRGGFASTRGGSGQFHPSSGGGVSPVAAKWERKDRVKQPISPPLSSLPSSAPQETTTITSNTSFGQRTVSAYSTTPDQIWVPKKQSETTTETTKEQQVQEESKEKEETKQRDATPTSTQYQSRPSRSSYHGSRAYSSNFGSPQRNFHATVGFETQNARHSSYHGHAPHRGNNAGQHSFYAGGAGHPHHQPQHQHWQQVQHHQQQYRPRTEWREKGTTSNN